MNMIQKEKEEENKRNKKKLKKEKRDNQGKGISFFVELLKTVVLAVLIVVPIKTFLIQPFFVQGSSMQPNFHDGDYLIIREIGYKTTVLAAGNKEIFKVKPFKNVRRQDVIVFKNPQNQNQFFIKRVIGLPGERVVIADGIVKIYNKENPEGFILDEGSYLPADLKTKSSRNFQLKEGEYVVLGDNRNNSSDSRYWGILKKELIVGKVSLRAWPLNNFKFY